MSTRIINEYEIELYYAVVGILRMFPQLPDDADWVHGAVIERFDYNRFDVFHETAITLPNGEKGRIDVVIGGFKWKSLVAIEIDAHTPNPKSIEKLKAFDGFRILVLRGVVPVSTIYGIDAVIGLNVRPATAEEIADKKRVSKAVWKVLNE